MLKAFAEELSLIMVANKIIPIEKRKYYTYGFELILNDILIFTSVSIIAVLTNTLITSFLFTIVFCVLRAYVGGYHCRSYSACVFTALTNYICMLLLNAYIIHFKLIISLVLIGISIMVITILAPVEHENNPLSTTQKKKYKKYSIILIIIITTGFIISVVFSKLTVSFAISWAMFAVFLLLLPTIRLERREKRV